VILNEMWHYVMALRYVMQNILIYRWPRWRHDPSPYRSWILMA